MVVLEGEKILLSALQPETITRRFNTDSLIREEKEETEADDE